MDFRKRRTQPILAQEPASLEYPPTQDRKS